MYDANRGLQVDLNSYGIYSKCDLTLYKASVCRHVVLLTYKQTLQDTLSMGTIELTIDGLDIIGMEGDYNDKDNKERLVVKVAPEVKPPPARYSTYYHSTYNGGSRYTTPLLFKIS